MGDREKGKMSVIKRKIYLGLTLSHLSQHSPELEIGYRELWRGGLGPGSQFPLPEVLAESPDFKSPWDQTQTGITH